MEDTFKINFVPHESHFYGDYYSFRKDDFESASLMLHQNIRFEDELLHLELPENCVLLSVNSTSEWENVGPFIARLGAKLIRQDNYE